MTSFFNIGLHTDYNFEYGDQIWRLASLGGHLASTTAIINPNDPWKAAPAILAAKRPTIRVYNVEQAMVGTDEGISGMNDAELKVRARQNAQWAVAAIEPLFAVYPGAYWQWYRNEVGNFGKARFYKFENIAWIEELSAHGQLASAFGFSVGTPELHIWPEFDDVLAALNNARGQAAIHEYSLNGKDMRSAFDPAKGTGYHVGRYRMVWGQQRYPSRFPNVRWKIKELGMDFDVTVNPPTGGPWKGRITPQGYINELFWVNDTLLVPDGVAADVYQLGRDAVWSGYDVYGDVLNGLITKISASTPNLVTSTTPPPEPPPDPKPDPDPQPAPVNLLVNPSFEGGHSFDPADKFGDRKVPTGWGIGWNTKQAAPHVELDQHPPRVTDGSVALRIWADSRFQAWAWQQVTVTPGAVYELRDKAIGHRLDVTRGKVQVDIAVDTFAGDDYTLANYKSGNTSEEEWRTPTIRFTATQALVTVFVEVRTGSDGRGDGWHDGVELVKISDPAPQPDPEPKPGLYSVADVAEWLNGRSQPSVIGAAVARFLEDRPPLDIEKFVIGDPVEGVKYWGKLRGQNIFLSAKYLKGV